jgi:hypothetical protein
MRGAFGIPARNHKIVRKNWRDSDTIWLIKSIRRHYLIEIHGALARHNYPCCMCQINRDHPKETKMRKTFLTILAASLIVGSTIQIAAATEHYTRKSDRAQAPASERFRNANDSLASPAVEQQNWSDYSEGHVISAPAGQ